MKGGKAQKQQPFVKKNMPRHGKVVNTERWEKEKKQQKAIKKSPSMGINVAYIERWKYYVTLAIILLLSFILYYPTLKNGFVWDDEVYIINNNLIKDLSWESIKAIFNNFSSDNYAPITDLINAVQFRISGLSPAAFHFGSLVFHLLNGILVFWFIKLLSGNWNIAVITSLLFAIHPMQVESVAWASGGSNLYYAAFFLGSLVAYLYYLQQNLKRYLVISLMFFILSLTSKAVAVVLPVVLLLIDNYKDRKITIKLFLEKSPFFILSIGMGILTLVLKNNVGNVQDITLFSFPQQIIFACYGFITYLFKLFLPLNLSAYYPYPTNGIDIPIQFYKYLFFVLGLTAYIIYSHRFSKKIIFGMGFFALTVFLVLQLLPVGGAIMADRYCYIPSIGIFYLTGEGLNLLWNKKLKYFVIILLSAFTIFFFVKTYTRCSIWRNDITLWNDVINRYKTIPIAYYNRGDAFMDGGKYNQAIDDYSKAIALKPNYTKAYYARGTLFMRNKKFDQAEYDFNKALELNPNYSEVYFNRGILYMNGKKFDKALDDFNKSLTLNPNYVEAYINRGIVFMNENKYDEALNDFSKAITLNPNYIEAYINRGSVFMNSKKYDQALNDFSRAITLNPNSPEAYFNRGVIFFNEKNYEQAISNYSKAIEINASDAVAFYFRGWAEYYLGKKEPACLDFKQAANLGYKLATDALLQLCK